MNATTRQRLTPKPRARLVTDSFNGLVSYWEIEWGGIRQSALTLTLAYDLLLFWVTFRRRSLRSLR